jgi:polyisoprenoid-binding protein YceI
MMVKAKVMRNTAVVFLLSAIAWPTIASAEPRLLQFGPPSSEVAFRAYKLGLLPLDGRFQHFGGRLSYDPYNHGNCQVELSVDAASLATEDPSMLAIVAGPDFLDVTDLPSLSYSGSCDGGTIYGILEMHGVSHPFKLDLTWAPDEVHSEGRLLRAAWCMTAMPTLAGRTIRIKVSIPLPAK